MKGNCADLNLGDVVKLPGLAGSNRETRPPPPCKAGFSGLSHDAAAGTVARHNGPVERAGWRVATGRARFIRVLGGWPQCGQRPYRHVSAGVAGRYWLYTRCMAL
ncbi:hypothetical protein S380_21915 [Salmonella enterica]|nr:hypothetical protein [Salmonella enterica]EBW0737450.1 hypothetical protein [Salmonella enterica subsp. enterica serovar Heidelberg]ECM0504426.1 hypothetical protein [Salmonella enterica subsp. enterica serovar Heidelberg]ECV2406380.1 hypothetical protein [Salmonella enterica subsp. enterica serovar Typhimurium]